MYIQVETSKLLLRDLSNWLEAQRERQKSMVVSTPINEQQDIGHPP